MQGASLQCMHATEIDFSPGTPSFSVTTRRRFTPQGTSCSLLQAVTQPLHSIQRSASHRNFIRAIVVSSFIVAVQAAHLPPVALGERGGGEGGRSAHLPQANFSTWH